MQNTFEEIRRQIHEIRNFLQPFDLKLAVLEDRIVASRAFFEQRIGSVESTTLANTLKLEEQGLTIMELLERVNWLELALKTPPKPARISPGPDPGGLPTQNPNPSA